MSTNSAISEQPAAFDAVSTKRLAALAGVVLLTGAYVSVLYHVTDVVGGASTFLGVVAGALVLGTLVGRVLRVRAAVTITTLLVVGGLLTYVFALPPAQRSMLTPGRVVADTVMLLTGLSVLRLVKAGIWALAIAPGPVFFSWYLAMRGRYVGSVAVGSVALGIVVLTGDANLLVTLVGVCGATIAVGVGTLPTTELTRPQAETLATVLAAMIVLSATLSVVPGEGATAGSGGGGSGSGTLATALVETDDRVRIQGSISLSPTVRFTIRSDERAYWQVSSYDRYTGQGWIRTGQTRPYTGEIRGPPGPSREVNQRVTAESRMNSLPAAWRPVRVGDGFDDQVEVMPQGSLQPTQPIQPGETYTVESQVPQYTEQQLRTAGTDYPERVSNHYLQLPDTTSDRVRQKAAEIAGNESTPYAKAVAIEQYLEENKEYSLSVDRPSGEVAHTFLFEMESGYCVYYATTMVVLLRSQGVPARFATGYTPGQQVDGNEWVVRGLNAHAWVEVYFPDVGWVRFDPTPASARQQAEAERLQSAREQDITNVDTNSSADEPIQTPTPTTPTRPQSSTNTTASDPDGFNESRLEDRLANGSTPGANQSSAAQGSTGSGWQLPSLPSRRTLGLGAIALIGLATGVRRSRTGRQVRETVAMQYQKSRETPEADVRQAFDRLERLLARQYRPRQTGETLRVYLDRLERQGVDERVLEVGALYEQARYGGGVTESEARTAVRRVNALTRRTLPVVGRFWE